jgi:hypothetical protein
MAADYASLEARVADLEQQVRHMLPAKIDVVSYAVSLVHEDTRYLREQSDIHGPRCSSWRLGWTGTATCCKRSSGGFRPGRLHRSADRPVTVLTRLLNT